MSDRFPAPLDRDWTPIPNALDRHAAALGLDDRDCRVIRALEGHRWRLGEPVQIGQAELARQACVSRRTLQRVTARLHWMGLVLKSQPGAENGRGRSRTEYDLDPLWHRLAELKLGIWSPPKSGDQIEGIWSPNQSIWSPNQSIWSPAMGEPRTEVPEVPETSTSTSSPNAYVGPRARGPEPERPPVGDGGDEIDSLGGNGEEGGGDVAPPASSRSEAADDAERRRVRKIIRGALGGGE